ncbi:hypothetical protein [Paludisphaera rhizosphaerae]|uniref:hypothetical protein n=1 Tax=Paludisphaera rhizosphaerae TaxID=2711216 RepID=UPI0013ED098A|nr:hypothetical protein [Paludisphaera rhizosphaerae]
MSLMMPHEGGLQFLAEALDSGEDWSLCLYISAISGTESSAAATYTAAEASFTGYSRKTLTRAVGAGNWATPSLSAPSSAWSTRTQVATATYAAQSWTNTSGSSVTVYGYFLLGATSGKLILFEPFASARTLADGDSLAITPQIQLA